MSMSADFVLGSAKPPLCSIGVGSVLKAKPSPRGHHQTAESQSKSALMCRHHVEGCIPEELISIDDL